MPNRWSNKELQIRRLKVEIATLEVIKVDAPNNHQVQKDANKQIREAEKQLEWLRKER